MPLYRAAHGRSGGKGKRSSLRVIGWHPALWPLPVDQVTEAALAVHLRGDAGDHG